MCSLSRGRLEFRESRSPSQQITRNNHQSSQCIPTSHHQSPSYSTEHTTPEIRLSEQYHKSPQMEEFHNLPRRFCSPDNNCPTTSLDDDWGTSPQARQLAAHKTIQKYNRWQVAKERLPWYAMPNTLCRKFLTNFIGIRRN